MQSKKGPTSRQLVYTTCTIAVGSQKTAKIEHFLTRLISFTNTISLTALTKDGDVPTSAAEKHAEEAHEKTDWKPDVSLDDSLNHTFIALNTILPWKLTSTNTLHPPVFTSLAHNLIHLSHHDSILFRCNHGPY